MASYLVYLHMTCYSSLPPFQWIDKYKIIKTTLLYTVDQETFIIKKVKWDKSSMHFNLVNAESMSTQELCY